MAQTSSIEWTDATWNPVTGCTKLSAGCDNCYAEAFAERFRGVKGHPYENGFDIQLRPSRLEEPLKWRKPRMIFVNSMSDLFQKEIPNIYIDKVFDIMEFASWHTFQVLTKRSSLMRDYLSSRFFGRKIPQHIWMGVSVEHRQTLSRMHQLKQAAPGIKFLSIEPLLEDLGEVDFSGIDWIIVGGESGRGARPMNSDWVRRLRDAAIRDDVPFFFKQWGAFGPSGVRRPKGENGRELDGRTWDELPRLSTERAPDVSIRLGG